MKKTLITSTLSILILLLSTGCQAVGSPSAEQAAANQVLAHPGEGVVIDPASIEFVQTQVFEGSTYVMLAYQRMWNNRDEKCLSIYETRYRAVTGWTGGSGGGMCWDRIKAAGETDNPLHLSSLTFNRSDQNKPDISTVIGVINDPGIVKVVITWKDGQTQEALVANNTFFTVRTGKVEMGSTEGLGVGNAVIYTLSR